MTETAAYLGIFVVAAAVYAMRLAGYVLGSRVRRNSTASRVLDTLPGAALAAVLALSLLEYASLPDLLALAATTVLFLWSGKTLPSLAAGLAIAVLNAHLVA